MSNLSVILDSCPVLKFWPELPGPTQHTPLYIPEGVGILVSHIGTFLRTKSSGEIPTIVSLDA